MCLSVPHSAVAATRTSTSSGLGMGTGQSRISVPEGPLTGFVLTTAFITPGARRAMVAWRRFTARVMHGSRRKRAPGRFVESRTRVRYKDTDQMGIAHHSNYIVWFEVGRT